VTHSKANEIQSKVTKWYKKFKNKILNRFSTLLNNVWDKKDKEMKDENDNIIDEIDSAYIYDAFPYDFITGEKIINASSFNY